MNNRKFHFQLRTLKDSAGRRWTVGRIAEAIYVNRSHLNCVLNNQAGRGKVTRRKVVTFFERHLPEQRGELLAALGWDAKGNIKQPTVLADGHHAQHSVLDQIPSPRPSPRLGGEREKPCAECST